MRNQPIPLSDTYQGVIVVTVHGYRRWQWPLSVGWRGGFRAGGWDLIHGCQVLTAPAKQGRGSTLWSHRNWTLRRSEKKIENQILKCSQGNKRSKLKTLYSNHSPALWFSISISPCNPCIVTTVPDWAFTGDIKRKSRRVYNTFYQSPCNRAQLSLFRDRRKSSDSLDFGLPLSAIRSSTG